MFRSKSGTHRTEGSIFESETVMALNALLYTFLWGCAFPLVKICMESFRIDGTDNMAKCLLAGIRFTASGLIILLCHAVFEKGDILPRRRQSLIIPLYGLAATTLQYAFTYIGLSMIDGSKGAVYDQLCVFLIVLTGGLFFKSDKLDLRKVIGCIFGFLGILAINAEQTGFSFQLGEGVMLLSVISQTAAYFIAKGSAETVPALQLTGGGQVIGGITLCAVSLLFGGRIRVVNITGIITLFLLILISAIAYPLSLIPLKYHPVSKVSSFNLLITVFGVVMSAALLGENVFRIRYAVSLLFICLGILCVNWSGRTTEKMNTDLLRKKGNRL